ncbi:MAG: glycosyltransferase family 39 protein [Phycisphaerae bacterium]|nr:glycosyltransferase family 39 protein [Phycisphaerae bacterium]MDD5381715.1 glycosyltransferase family 39 protein [Phycisphaerae bacterium]
MMDEQSSRRKTVIHISILLAAAFCVGVYLVGTTVLIAKDGITFIEYARGLETSPIKAMKSEFQHPGYPFLIAVAHKIAKIGQDGSSLRSWIYSAQAVTLVFRLLAVVLLYFVGKKIVGERFSFWAILILILLPDAAEYGSDALSDWPYIFFLSAGFLLLIHGAVSGKWWLFGFSGLAAGMGYLIRPECAQIVVLGTLWLGLQVFYSQRIISKHKAVFAFVLLLAGFLVTAGPYMKLKGAVFPKKQLVHFMPERQTFEIYEQTTRICPNSIYTAGFAPSDIAEAWGKLVQRVSETLMWFFVPALLIGSYRGLRKGDWREPEKFFVIVLIALNVLIMTLLYYKFGYMSRRHTLPLVVFTIFYVPIGIEMLASWLSEKFSNNANTDFWFLALILIGIAICSPKLLRPIRAEKQSYRDAARWLAKNTDEGDIIAAPDIRIGFYSGRRSIEYDDRGIPKEAQYVVKAFKDEQDTPGGEEMLQAKEVFTIEGKNKKSKLVIYRQKY